MHVLVIAVVASSASESTPRAFPSEGGLDEAERRVAFIIIVINVLLSPLYCFYCHYYYYYYYYYCYYYYYYYYYYYHV